MNDTMGPEFLVPSLLVFGILPRFPSLNTELPNQTDRMIALEMAQVQMASINAKLKVQKALRSKLPRLPSTKSTPATTFSYIKKPRSGGRVRSSSRKSPASRLTSIATRTASCRSTVLTDSPLNEK